MTLFDWLSQNPGWFLIYLLLILMAMEDICHFMRKK